ncbi:MAG: thiamine-phosphate pyrophosphorylase [Candidatus Omnitrophica bacterium]|jgi:thiamine-phosphate pyrophosphorylase|nr:thiamine-phosphate pyrophosphorylase [Candidatus Omnitrophota bacterium]
MDKKGLLRVLDANFNRSKEALRVIEDIFRFVSDNDKLRKKARTLRHSLDEITKNKLFKEAVKSRNSVYDLGRKIDALELNRKTSRDILYANLQRAKESVRVLEEFFKIISPSQVKLLKKIRYDIYSLEKKIYIYKEG